MGKDWHEELAAKVGPVCKHLHWAIRNCEGDEQKLKDSLDNIVRHFKGDHSQCSSKSRCQRDPHYESRSIVISDPKAEKLLSDAIRKSVVYRNPADFALAKETHFVESFNNVMNMFQDKRISFSDREYDIRA